MLVATLVVTAVSWTALRDAPYLAPTPDDPSQHPVADEAARTLDLLAAAVNEGDREAASVLAPSGDDEARALLADIVDNADDLRLEELSLRYVGEDGGVSAAGAWPAAVEATWRLPEDDAPSRTELQVGLVTAGTQVGIRFFGGAGRTPVWLTGPVTGAPGARGAGRGPRRRCRAHAEPGRGGGARRTERASRLDAHPRGGGASDGRCARRRPRRRPGDLCGRGRGDRERRRLIGSRGARPRLHQPAGLRPAQRDRAPRW